MCASILRRSPVLLAVIGVTWLWAARCSPTESENDGPGDTTTVTGGSFFLMYARRYFTGREAPLVVIKRTDDGTIDKSLSGNITVEVEGLKKYSSTLSHMKRGYGAALISFGGGTTAVLRNNSGAAIGRIPLEAGAALDTIELSGIIPTSLISVGPDTVVRVTGDITIAPAASLTLRAGVVVLLAHKVNVTVEGSLICSGTSANPVLFAPRDRQAPWGGIVVQGQASLAHVLVSGGGGRTDSLSVRGHSNSQPVVYNSHGSVALTSCYFVYNTGKALYASQGTIVADSCLFAFCDMGGEFDGAEIEITNSYFLFIPDAGIDSADDDNDALYFFDVPGAAVDSVFSTVTGCTFYHGKDDCIDHNKAFVRVSNCWIEGFQHEGIAASSANRIDVSNSYFTACGQAVEAGWGSPVVTVDHCLVAGNGVGMRFGDNYTLGCSGSLVVGNSIVWGNGDNIKNLDMKTGGPVDSALAIYNSIIDSMGYEPGGGNVCQAPVFAAASLLLAPSSAGKSGGSDGNDMGLVSEP